jgi:hypothetical protein
VPDISTQTREERSPKAIPRGDEKKKKTKELRELSQRISHMASSHPQLLLELESSLVHGESVLARALLETLSGENTSGEPPLTPGTVQNLNSIAEEGRSLVTLLAEADVRPASGPSAGSPQVETAQAALQVGEQGTVGRVPIGDEVHHEPAGHAQGSCATDTVHAAQVSGNAHMDLGPSMQEAWVELRYHGPRQFDRVAERRLGDVLALVCGVSSSTVSHTVNSRINLASFRARMHILLSVALIHVTDFRQAADAKV